MLCSSAFNHLGFWGKDAPGMGEEFTPEAGGMPSGLPGMVGGFAGAMVLGFGAAGYAVRLARRHCPTT